MRLALLLLILGCACERPYDDDDDDDVDPPLPDAAVVLEPDAAVGTPDARPGTPDARPGTPDARPGTPDARPGTPDATPSPVVAIGRAATVDVVCWNVRQFPATSGTVQALASAILALDVDVVALAEIDDDASFEELIDLLPGWQGFLGDGDGYIKMALVWRTAGVTVTGLGNIFDFDFDFPRAPLVATLARGSDSVTLINVHLKAGRNPEDATRRRNANTKLAGWIGERGNPDTLLCGDFNEDQNNAYAPDVYGAYLAAPQIYRMLTRTLDLAGSYTYLPGRIMFDQMISTVALDAELGGEVPFIPRLDQQIPDYEDTISDHLPVAIRLDLH